MPHRSPDPSSRALPSQEEFLRLARDHTLVPVYLTLTADLETPVTAFLRLAGDQEQCFLLESVEQGERLGRYTFMGIEPYRTITARGRALTEANRAPKGSTKREPKTRTWEGDIFAVLKEALDGHSPARVAGLPPFTAGAVGFFAYDVVRQIERLPSLAPDELGIPDATLMFFDEVLAFDHLRKQMVLIVNANVRDAKPEKAYRHALKRLRKLERALERPLSRKAARGLATRGGEEKLAVHARTEKAAYCAAVDQAKEYIRAGDVFQVVLSQRFDVEPGVEPFRIYRALRTVNPSPYTFFLRTGPLGGDSLQLAGSSPELLVRVTGDRIEYRPIAGTRRRGADEGEDQRVAEELLADEKERAEHVMLVDLGRNDVGRVSDYGTVQVRELMRIERYSHVMHIVSAIEGKLRAGLHPVDAFRACFPAGTLSGAPKIRAMEVIEELEPARRGIYGGSVLYADFSGNLDSCIAIRTLVMQGERGHVQAGAGIVADSVPEKEWEECVNKASAVLEAIERARG